MKPHLLFLDLSDEHIGIRIECPGADGGCQYWIEDLALAPGACHCQAGADDGPCDACADDQHEACADSIYIDDIGSSCQCVEVEGSCCVKDADCTQEELIDGNEWPKDEYPVRAEVRFIDGYPTLRPWKDPT